SNEPRPNCPLVIGEISCSQVTEILWLIVRVARRQRTQSIWRKQLIVYHVNDGLPMLWIEYWVRQRDREQLVRSNRVIVTVLTVHDIEQCAVVLVPETPIERFTNPVGAVPVAFCTFLIVSLIQPLLHQTHRVVPERVDLDSLAAPR